MNDNTNKNRQELIDRYLLGEMSEPELKAFEEQMANDEELLQDVDISRHIVKAFQYEGEQRAFDTMKFMSEEDLKKVLNLSEIKMTEDNISTTHKIKPVYQKRSFSWLIPVSVAAATILIFLYIGFRPKYSTEQLFSQYYVTQSYETHPTRGGSELSIEEKKLIQQAKSFYLQKEYQQALSLYNQYLKDKPDWKIESEEVIFHSAICQFETGETSGSIEKLSFLASSGQSDFQDEALWNLAFAYLKENQRNKAMECLQQLIEKESDYAADASKLSDQINKRKWF